MKSLSDYILSENCLSQELCEEIISTVDDDNTWQKHTWYDGSNDRIFNKKNEDNYNEFDVVYLSENNSKIYEKLYPILIDLCKEYCIKYSFDKSIFVNRIFPVRVNKYQVNTKMNKHYDHIHSLFSPPIKGIPALTILGVLNDSYEGGEFILFDDFEIKTKRGDIIIFPSNFMYPHKVNKINKGTRYSFVTWAV